MPPTPIEQLKREALAGLQYHPDDIRAVCAAGSFAPCMPAWPVTRGITPQKGTYE